MLNNMDDLLEKTCAKLEAYDIQYMISGSLALLAYSTPRMTRDIDIVVNIQESDLSKFLEIFKDGFYLHPQSIQEEIKRRGMFNVIDYNSGFKIDFIVRKNTPFHINEFNRRIITNVYNFPAYMVSLEDLVIAKIKWIQEYQSENQINDIVNLIKNPNIDLEYVYKWCREMNLNTFNIL